MSAITEECQRNVTESVESKTVFASIFIFIFLLSVTLNSFLLVLVTKRNYFDFDKQASHKLFQILIALDLVISILILPNVLIKRFAKDPTHLAVDVFRSVRDSVISIQVFLLLLIAVDGLVSILYPIQTFWNLNSITKTFASYSVVISLIFFVKLVVFNVNLSCGLVKKINRYFKLTMGVIGGIIMATILSIYVCLFVLIFRQQFDRHVKFPKQRPTSPLPVRRNEERNFQDQRTSKFGLEKLMLGQKILQMKFVKVLFLVNLLMVISFLPVSLYNSGLLRYSYFKWASYLFYIHSLGDAIIFLFVRFNMKNDMTKVFRKKGWK